MFNNELVTARYFNANGVAVAIVASVNRRGDGSVFDWAAYIGGSTKTMHEHQCVNAVAERGVKLLIGDAIHFFPDLPVEKYRA